MPSSLSSLVGKAQSVKAQALSTLMAALTQVQATSGVSGNAADNPQASLQSAEAALKATLIAVDPQGKAIVDIAGNRVEAQLPQEMLSAGAKNPDLLRPGTRLLLPPDVPARILTPATRVEVQGQAQGTSVGPAPALASPFPPGSLGAAITKLTGIALPGAEATVKALPAAQGVAAGQPQQPASPAPASPAALTSASTPAPVLPAPTFPALRPGMISHIVQPEILTALVQASGKQVPLAQGLNALLALPPEALNTLPDSVQAVLKSLAALRSTPQQLASPQGLQQAVANSGTFMEARLASLSQGSAMPDDFKTLLLSLKSLLEPPAPADAAKSAPLASHAPAAQPRTPAPALPEMQRAVEGTLERIKLTQIASLPEHPEITFTDDRVQPMRLAVSLPLATEGHDRASTAVLGLVIEHRPPLEKPQPLETEDETSAITEGFPWKVRIALDLEETGPVQAEIALRGQSVGVTLWAEQKNMAEAARAEIGALHKALTGAAFDVVNLEVKDGFPHLKAQPHAPVLDKRT